MFKLLLPTDFGLKLAVNTPFSYSVVNGFTSSLGEQHSIDTSLPSDSEMTCIPTTYCTLTMFGGLTNKTDHYTFN